MSTRRGIHESELPPHIRAQIRSQLGLPEVEPIFKPLKKAPVKEPPEPPKPEFNRPPPPKEQPRYGTLLLIAIVAAFWLFNHQWSAPVPENPFKFDLPNAPVPPLAPRAQPAVPRAQLVRWPWKVGQSVKLMMSYNLEVQTNYRGVRSSQNLLPQNSNHIGDMFVINGTPWIWLVSPGASRAAWIDP
jgi:hypothetical protein